MHDFVQVFTTTEKREDADRIAQTMVEKRLAACAQILGPIRSTYWWQGKLQVAEEWLCLMKTRASSFGEFDASLREIHAYETPEIVALPIVAGSPGYMKWLDEEIRSEEGSSQKDSD